MKHLNKTKLKTFGKSFLCLLLAALVANPTSAAQPSEADLDKMNAIGAYYYNPMGSSHSSGCFGAIGTNMNYAGATVFSDADLQAIEENRPFYEAAAQKAEAQGFFITWQIIATIHSMEHSLQRSNPSNGQGAYQLYSYTGGGKNSNAFLPAGAISDEEFQRQTDIAVLEVMQAKASGLDLSNPEDVKQFFLNYNGSGDGHYAAIAQAMFGPSTPAYEGSPYVMSRYDARRDGTLASPPRDPEWRGMYVGDGVWNSEYVWKGIGAFVKYEALGGGYSSVACGGLISGGMSYDEAYAFVQEYVDNPNECEQWSSICHIYGKPEDGKIGEPGANCVTFVQYFLSKYTSLGIISPMGNGGDVVNNLINDHGLIDGGNTPRPYAVFSTRSPKWSSAMCGSVRCGHTGIVLGIDEAAGKIYIGQMAYGSLKSWGLTRIEYNLDDYSSEDFTYAYTDEFLKI